MEKLKTTDKDDYLEQNRSDDTSDQKNPNSNKVDKSSKFISAVLAFFSYINIFFKRLSLKSRNRLSKPVEKPETEDKTVDTDETVDDKQIAIAKRLIKKYFGGDYLEKSKSYTVEGKKKLLSDFFNDIKKEYGLKTSLSFEKITPEYTADKSSCLIIKGVYKESTDTISINELLLDPESTYNPLYTLLHEIRHTLQFYAIINMDYQSYGKERVLGWSYNFVHYIDSKKDFEAYSKQLVESDANQFASYLTYPIINK